MRTAGTFTASRLITRILTIALLLATAAPARAADEPFEDRAACDINNNPDSIETCYSQTGNLSFYCSWNTVGQARWYVDGDLVWTDPDLAASSSTYIHRGRSSAQIECRWSSIFCGEKRSSKANLIVNYAPSITGHPQSATRCAGTSITLSATVNSWWRLGTSYQWKKGSVNLSNIPGKITNATGSALTISNITSADAGDYTLVATNSCGSVSTFPATLTVISLPAVTDPTPVTLCTPGGTVTFTVAPSASPSRTFQWQKNVGTVLVDGAGVSGATGPTLTLTNVDAGDAGMYRCVVADPCATVTTNFATLAINAGPVITSQPRAVSQCSGAATFTVAASGTPAPTYRWRKGNTDLSDDLGYSGTSTATLNVLNVATAGTSTFSCVVTNSCGSVTSIPAALTVDTTPTIATQPVAVAKCLGTDATFTVGVSYPAAPTYQWKKGTDLLADVAGQVSGSRTSTLTLHAIDEADLGAYSCQVDSACSSVQSAAAALTINPPPPVITTHPIDVRACSGNATFSVAATSASAMTYRWRKNGTNLNDAAGQISGAASASLTILNKDSNDNGQYTCVVSNGCGSIISNAAELSSVPVITTQPASVNTCRSQNVSFSVGVSHTAPIYQWKLGTTILVDSPGSISGATTATLTVLNAQLSDAGSYTCTVFSCTGAAGVTSSTANLTVKSDPWIQVQATSITRCSGADATFSVTASSSAAYLPQSYQWKKGATVLTNIPGQVSGANTLSLTLHAVDSSDAGSYTCVVTNDCGVEISQARTLTVTTGPSITQQPSPLTLCAGNSNATFTVAATGTPAPTYRWQKNAQNLSNIAGEISGATSASLTLTGVDANDAATYRCVITNSCGSTTSTDAVLIVNTGPSITAHPQNASGCASTPASFSITTDDLSPAYRWQWLPQGSATWLDLTNGDNLYENSTRLSVAGATVSTLSVTPLAGIGSLASFRCVLGNTCSSTTSNPAAILICVSDLTCDTLVDDSDFQVFVVAYNTLDCADPTMPTYCPADLNRDTQVDDADFVLFIAAYDMLVCP